MTIIIRRPWTRQPQYVTGQSELWVPDYLWNPAVGNYLRGRGAGFFGDVNTGVRSPTEGGVAYKYNGASTYTNWTISRANEFPIVIAASFVCVNTSAAVQTAFSLGGAALDQGNYSGVGQYSATTIDSWLRIARGGSDFLITGPTAVVGQRYNVIRLSRSTNDNAMYVNGIRYVVGGSAAIPDDSWKNVTAGTCVRDTTPIFYGNQIVSQGFVAIGRAPSDAWAREWSLNPNIVYGLRQIIIPTAAAAGYAHPTLSNARMGSLTSTGGVPLVGYAF